MIAQPTDRTPSREVEQRATSGMDQAGTAAFVEQENRQVLESYQARPSLIEEHANYEQSTAEGAYGRRQLFELIQNGSDAILASKKPGIIQAILTENALYCADTGVGVTCGGIRAILQAYMSPKEDEEIGRYGLGFKSVLGATRSPEFYSNSVSFCFDADWSRQQIRQATGYEGATPALRLARTVDRNVAAARDLILGELLTTASTVVKLPFLQPPPWLREDFEDFPNAFLLFCSHIEALVLDDRTQGVKREVRRIGEAPVRIEDNGRTSQWRVFRKEIRPPEAARQDGGAIAGRDRVLLSWAVPLSSASGERGFWAYFPLRNEPMSLAGIVNAAWKLNDDRQNILDGPFNEALLEQAALLVLDSLPSLTDATDPAKLLDVYPARPAERVTYADREITAWFYRHAADFPTIPDVEGKLSKASDLELPPSRSELNDEAIEAWARCPYKPATWAHPGTIMHKDRSARLDYLMPEGRSRAGIRKWLEALCSGALATLPDDVTAIDQEIRVRRSKWALIAASALRERSREVFDSKILLTESGKFVAPDPHFVFLPGSDGKRYARVDLVDAGLARDPEALRAITELGVHEVDASSELKALLGEHPIGTLSDAEWRELWELVGRVERDPKGRGQSARIICDAIDGDSPANVIRVQTIDGGMHPLVETLLAGPIVPADGSRDADVVIDPNFHAAHYTTLRELGAIDQPDSMVWRQDEAWVRGYHGEMAERLRKSLKPGQNKPQPQMLKLLPKTYVGPLAAFPRLSAEGKRLFTKHILAHEQALIGWSMTHETRPDYYGTIECESPCNWMLKKHGMVSTSQGVRLLGTSVGSRLGKWRAFLAVAEGIEPATEVALGLAQTPEQITPGEWKRALNLLYGRDFDPQEIASFYAAFCKTHEAPDGLRCIEGTKQGVFPPEEVTIAPSRDRLVCDALREERIPFLVLDDEEESRELCLRWRLRSFRDVIRIESHSGASGPDTPLVDQYPGLLALATTDRSDIILVPCQSLRREIRTDRGVKAEEVGALRDRNRILYDDRLSREDLLDTVAEQLELPLTPDQKVAILSQQLDAELRARMRKIASLDGPAKKLLHCVGAEALRKRLARPLLDSVQRRFGELNDIDYAGLFLSVYGVEAISLLKEELKSAGFRAPEQWAGGHAARAFVAELGLPDVYAGFSVRGSREPYLDIEPTPKLPVLHDFQKKVVANIGRLLTIRSETRRGLLSLPTGAGKTRVAVEALTHSFLSGKIPTPALWIAQTDELCEQAVQAWSEVWRASASNRALRVNRLWAQNAADRYDDAFQVVIATIQKLGVIAGCEEYAWLKDAGVVVIDEAHYSVTPEYTKILDWLGISDRQTRCPLIGLTATAFRGGERETSQLVRRYSDNRLDKGAFKKDPYVELQKMGVLSQVDHERLDGVEVTLTEAESDELKRLNQLPAAAVRRIAEDLGRNAKIIESVRSKPQTWPVLIFAASVEHARTLSALLEREGISSASVCAETSPGARRHYIEQFRAGQLRVLTNYGVLTTGFDAPAVRAIYVTRPTFSPSLYQQMIGRGLRGIKNGGKERCLIVNVDDNFARYGVELAFRGFEPLWSRA